MAKKPDQPEDERPAPHEKPISLHPLTVEEALKKAMEAPPKPDDDKPKRKQG